MIEAILAIDNNFGIGYKNKLPWHLPEELKLFKEKTLNKIVIVGRKTFESLPFLKGRKIICLSKNSKIIPKIIPKNIPIDTPIKVINSLEEIKNENVMIIGGAKVFSSAIKTLKIKKIHLSIVKGEYECDTFVDKNLFDNYVITETSLYDDFNHYVLEYTEKTGENDYLKMIKNILLNGKKRTGRNGPVTSLFNYNLKFNLEEQFPVLTTKKMFTKGIIEEFLFFIRGDTDSKILEENKVNIWKKNTTKDFIHNKGLTYPEGIMGPLYGYQWRFFNSEYKLDENSKPIKPVDGFNQLQNVIELIKMDPTSRRILLTSYNPIQAEEGVLYPCHSLIIQFYVDEEYLDMTCYNRSQDTFLGTPYNITSSSLLLSCIAKITNKKPRWLYMNLGDVHIYEGHEKCVETQISRFPHKFPTLNFPNIKTLEELCNLSSSDFTIENYNFHPTIKAEMVA